MIENPFSLCGKTILVTGASSGIGRAIAVQCSKMGAKVVVCGRNTLRIQETMSMLEGDGHACFEGDLTNMDNVNRLVDDMPKLQGVVLSAGRGLTLPFLFSDNERFEEMYKNNFFSPVEVFRLLVKKKKLDKNSSVVLIISTGGTRRFTVGNAIYGTAKAALESLVRFCAIELAGKKIRVNGICPGMVNTPLIKSGAITDNQLAKDMDNCPMKRYGEPEDIAYGAVYLLSDAASWVTGSSLVIDGGNSAR